MSLNQNHSRQRRGAILIIVVAFLALGLSVGIAFLFYANQHAVNMRIYREAYASTFTNDSPPIATDVFNAVIAQIIYDTTDDLPGSASAVRGFSLARDMYGQYYSGQPSNPTYSNNTIPFNGIGRFHAGGPMGSDLFNILNFQYHQSDGFVIDPERFGTRSDPTQSFSSAANYIPVNAPYTYPDNKSLYLAAINPQSGQVMVPSFHRPNIFGSLLPSNPNWHSAIGKYLTSRPRPQENPGFPYPSDAFGDVKNLIGAAGGNDSIWMDFGLPVKNWRGQNYKPLVALLVVDLDGRLNINSSGNRLVKVPPSTLNASLQGWGSWEINLNNIFNFNEAQNLFLNPNGRYGADLQPTKTMSPDGSPLTNEVAPSGTSGAYYAQGDIDGSIMTNGGGAPRLTLPLQGLTSPTFPPRYDNGSIAARTYHPLLYSPYFLSNSKSTPLTMQDRTFGPIEMQLLNQNYNYGNPANPNNYALSELAQLLPRNLGTDYSPGNLNPRFLMTTTSNDIDRPGFMPWIFNSPSSFQLNQPGPVAGIYPPAPQPAPGAVPFPSISNRAVGPVTGMVDDFNPITWKSIQSAFASIDLNRPLRDYRTNPLLPYQSPGNITANSYQAAMVDRQRLALDIFNRLCYAVGSNNTPTNPNYSTKTSSDYRGMRWLAQLAVNIVDYMDNDDFMTPFMWNSSTQEIIYGTELPRLVINEGAYVIQNGASINGEVDTDSGLVPPNPKPANWQPKATFYVGRIWLELHNPLTPQTASTASLSFGGGAPLTYNGNQVYRVLLSNQNRTLRFSDNLTGQNDAPLVFNNKANSNLSQSNAGIPVPITSSGFYPNDIVPPSNGNYMQPRSNGSSFCVVGPTNTPGDNIQPTITNPFMEFNIPVTTYNPTAHTFGANVQADVLLQRLACPFLPYNATTNPYITVDYMQFNSGMVNNNITISQNGLLPPANQIAITSAKSYGRNQPYAASMIYPQPGPNTLGMQHSLFQHNGRVGAGFAGAGATLQQPFDWLTHLDRMLISPVELFFASAYKPHELMQQFVYGGSKFQQLANWTDDIHRLHRALPLLTTRSNTLGIPSGGRVPGLVNINTIWSQNIWNAICDVDPGNYFMGTDVQNSWMQLSGSRSPAGAPSQPNYADNPFWSLGAPIDSGSQQFPNSIGVNNTILRNNGKTLMLDVASQSPGVVTTNPYHPYLQKELLNKVYNKLTTRSNVFAVWMTIGYFQVVNTATNPVQLGSELGISDGTNIRNKFFAIIDRTNVTQNPTQPNLQGAPPIFFKYEPMQTTPNVDPVTPGQVTVWMPGTVSGTSLSGIYENNNWSIVPGTKLILDVGPKQETVVVSAVGNGIGGPYITFTCTLPHNRGCAMMIFNAILGNPGPQPSFYYTNPLYAPAARISDDKYKAICKLRSAIHVL